MRFLCALMMFSLFGAQVQALSCTRPNVAQSFNWFQEAPETYRLMIGQIKMPRKIAQYVEGKPRAARAVATGAFLGRTGLGKQQTVPVIIQTHCVGPWCGGFPTDMTDDVIMYLKRTKDGDVIDIHACPHGFGQLATQMRVTLLRKCLRRGTCTNTEIKQLEQQ